MSKSIKPHHNFINRPLHQLMQAGFSADDLIRVLSHDGGSKNLQALCALLKPVIDTSGALQYADEVLLTPLYQLTQAGFSAADLIGVLSNIGGSKNLLALCSLLAPIVDVFEVPQYAGEVLLTPLHQLTQAGFSAADLIGVVSHGGGSKNLQALWDLVNDASSFFANYPHASKPIAFLANGAS